MSAFLCSDTHTYAAAIITLRLGSKTGVTENAILFRALNNAGLRSRYNDKAVPLEPGKVALVEAEKWVDAATPADHYHVLCCLQYQCAEGACEKRPGWATLKAAIETARARAGASISLSKVWSI